METQVSTVILGTVGVACQLLAEAPEGCELPVNICSLQV